MTEADLIEFIPLYVQTAQGSINTTLALIFGYIVAAYTAGVHLTRAQVMVGNIIYLVGVLVTVMSGAASTQRAVHFGRLLQEINPDETIAIAQVNPLLGYSVAVLLVSASLWFMWSVRHPKTE